MPRPDRFGRHLKSLRRGRNLTQEQLAERAGLSVDAIRRLEHDAFSPSLDTLTKLSSGLSITLGTLFTGYALQRRDHVAEICDFLAGRSGSELKLAWRVIRALFEEP